MTDVPQPLSDAAVDRLARNVVLHEPLAQQAQVVWGRVKGYPWWPAQVLPGKEAKQRLKDAVPRKEHNTPVMFFGTYEVAWLHSNDVQNWGEGVEKGHQAKGHKQKRLMHALDQVCAFLAGPGASLAPENWWCPAPGAVNDVTNRQGVRETKESQPPGLPRKRSGGAVATDAVCVAMVVEPKVDKELPPCLPTAPTPAVPQPAAAVAATKCVPSKYKFLRRNEWLSCERPNRKHKDDVHVCECAPHMAGPQVESAPTCCGEDCLNRTMRILCDEKTCPAGKLCSNLPFHMQRGPKVEVFHTGGRGFGVRALEAIPRGHFVMEYVGEVIDVKEMLKRLESAREKNEKDFYIMELPTSRGSAHNFSSQIYIDARHKGNMSRFINSCCEPNCETQKWTSAANDESHIGIFAMRDLVAGEELTYDYQFEHYGAPDQSEGFVCKCGAVNCRGTMDANPERFKDFGRRVDVYWDGDRVYYRGTITGYTPSTRKHHILYDDNTFECFELEKTKYRWLDVDAPEVSTGINSGSGGGSGSVTAAEAAAGKAGEPTPQKTMPPPSDGAAVHVHIKPDEVGAGGEVKVEVDLQPPKLEPKLDIALHALGGFAQAGGQQGDGKGSEHPQRPAQAPPSGKARSRRPSRPSAKGSGSNSRKRKRAPLATPPAAEAPMEGAHDALAATGEGATPEGMTSTGNKRKRVSLAEGSAAEAAGAGGSGERPGSSERRHSLASAAASQDHAPVGEEVLPGSSNRRNRIPLASPDRAGSGDPPSTSCGRRHSLLTPQPLAALCATEDRSSSGHKRKHMSLTTAAVGEQPTPASTSAWRRHRTPPPSSGGAHPVPLEDSPGSGNGSGSRPRKLVSLTSPSLPAGTRSQPLQLPQDVAAAEEGELHNPAAAEPGLEAMEVAERSTGDSVALAASTPCDGHKQAGGSDASRQWQGMASSSHSPPAEPLSLPLFVPSPARTPAQQPQSESPPCAAACARSVVHDHVDPSPVPMDAADADAPAGKRVRRPSGHARTMDAPRQPKPRRKLPPTYFKFLDLLPPLSTSWNDGTAACRHDGGPVGSAARTPRRRRLVSRGLLDRDILHSLEGGQLLWTYASRHGVAVYLDTPLFQAEMAAEHEQQWRRASSPGGQHCEAAGGRDSQGECEDGPWQRAEDCGGLRPGLARPAGSFRRRGSSVRRPHSHGGFSKRSHGPGSRRTPAKVYRRSVEDEVDKAPPQAYTEYGWDAAKECQEADEAEPTAAWGAAPAWPPASPLPPRWGAQQPRTTNAGWGALAAGAHQQLLEGASGSWCSGSTAFTQRALPDRTESVAMPWQDGQMDEAALTRRTGDTV